MVQENSRRHFCLPEEDVEFLTAKGWVWETIRESSKQWLLIHGFPIPSGFKQSSATAAIEIPAGYPTAPLDMTYFFPALSLVTGRGIPALSPQSIEGKEFQRWSRHRIAPGLWRPGEDNVHTHMSLTEEWLLREVGNV